MTLQLEPVDICLFVIIVYNTSMNVYASSEVRGHKAPKIWSWISGIIYFVDYFDVESQRETRIGKLYRNKFRPANLKEIVKEKTKAGTVTTPINESLLKKAGI